MAPTADKDGEMHPLPQDINDATTTDSGSDDAAVASRRFGGIQIRRVGGVLATSCLLAAGIAFTIATSRDSRQKHSATNEFIEEDSAMSPFLKSSSKNNDAAANPCGKCKGKTPFCDTTVKRCVACGEGADAEACSTGLAMLTDGSEFEFQFDLTILRPKDATPLIAMKAGLFSNPPFKLEYTGWPATVKFTMFTGFPLPYDVVYIQTGQLNKSTPYTITVYKDLQSLCMLTKAQSSTSLYDDKKCWDVRTSGTGLLDVVKWKEDIAKFGMEPLGDNNMYWPDVKEFWSHQKIVDVGNYTYKGGSIPFGYSIQNSDQAFSDVAETYDSFSTFANQQQDVVHTAMKPFITDQHRVVLGIAETGGNTDNNAPVESYQNLYNIYGSRRRLVSASHFDGTRRLKSSGGVDVQGSLRLPKLPAAEGPGFVSTAETFKQLVSDLENTLTSDAFKTVAGTVETEVSSTSDIENILIGLDISIACKKWTCPAGSKKTSVFCQGASCVERCCAPVSCHSYRCPKPYHNEPLLWGKNCFGDGDCQDTCCRGICKTFDCGTPPTSEVPYGEVIWHNSVPEYVTRCNFFKVWPLCKPSECLTTCCRTQNPPCCTDPYLTECAACMMCEQKDAFFLAENGTLPFKAASKYVGNYIEASVEQHIKKTTKDFFGGGKKRRLKEVTKETQTAATEQSEQLLDDIEEIDVHAESLEKVQLIKGGKVKDLEEKYQNLYKKYPDLNTDLLETPDEETAKRFLKDPMSIVADSKDPTQAQLPILENTNYGEAEVRTLRDVISPRDAILGPATAISNKITGGFAAITERAVECLGKNATEQTQCINSKIGTRSDLVGRCPYIKTAAFGLGAGLHPFKPKAVNSIRVLFDGTTAISGGDDGLAYLWKTDGGALNAVLGDPASTPVPYGPFAHPVTRVAPLPSVLYVVVTTAGGRIEALHNIDGLRHGPGITAPNNVKILGLAAFANWDLIGVTGEDNYTRLYNTANGNSHQVPAGWVSADAVLSDINTTMKQALKYAGVLDTSGMGDLIANATFQHVFCDTNRAQSKIKKEVSKVGCDLLHKGLCKVCNSSEFISQQQTQQACWLCDNNQWVKEGFALQELADKWYTNLAEQVNYDWNNSIPFVHNLTWGYAYAIVYFPSNIRFATGYGDGKIRYWNGNNGALLRTMWGHNGPVLSLWALPTTLNIVSGGMDGTIRIWHAPTGVVWRIMYTGSPVTSLTVIPTTGNLYSGHEDGYVRMWKVKTGLLLCKFPVYSKWAQMIGKKRVMDIAHNPGSATQILTAGADGWAKVWNVR